MRHFGEFAIHSIWSNPVTRTRSAYLALLAVLLSPVAANADPILVGDNEWRQVTDTVGFTWDQLITVCNPGTGVCDGSIDGVDFTGWWWASLNDIEGLFATLTPFSEGLYYEADSEWAPAFLDLFAPTQITAEQALIEGLSREQYQSATFTGLLFDAFDPSAEDLVVTRSTANDGDAFRVGAWLFRTATPVPEPGTLALFVIGLAGIGLARRRKYR